MPAWIIFSSMEGDELAGPIVQTIFVLRITSTPLTFIRTVNYYPTFSFRQARMISFHIYQCAGNQDYWLSAGCLRNGVHKTVTGDEIAPSCLMNSQITCKTKHVSAHITQGINTFMVNRCNLLLVGGCSES
jgi:hypothetical protein